MGLVCPYSRTINVRCRRPDGVYFKKPTFLPCGKCYCCRHNLVNSWVSRFLCECKSSDFQLFVTLTYADEHLYYNDIFYPSVCKEHVQKFLKRFRKDLGFNTVRYYACAEYGGRTYRPHYHLLCFFTGVSLDQARQSIVKTWHFGHAHIVGVGIGALRYCANFHVHKSSTPDGCDPTFTLMSRRPGIGGIYFDDRPNQFTSVNRRFTVHDGVKYPFGRYFHNRWMQQTGEVPPTKDFNYFDLFLDAYPDYMDYENAQTVSEIKNYLVNKRHNKL